jgi:hypothetical protein
MWDSIIQSENPFTQEQLQEGIKAWPRSLAACKRRSALFTALKKEITTDKQTNSDLISLSESVKKLEPLLREPTATELEGYSQIIFTESPFSGLNAVPFALILLSLYKSYIVPAFGVLLPFLTWILPYVFLKAFFSFPITFSQYSKVLWGLWNGTLKMPKSPQDFATASSALPTAPVSPLTQLKSLAQNGWTLFTIAQGVYQPIQQARHFIRLEGDCLELAMSVCHVKEIAVGILSRWGRYLTPWLAKWIDLCPSDLRRAFAFSVQNPFWLRQTLRALGRFEVLWQLAQKSDVVPVSFISSERPVLLLKGIGDPSITQEKRIQSNVTFGGKQPCHGILTGPNRGGKSSFMRAIYMSVCLAHAFGCSFGEKVVLTPFTWIANGLRLDDTPGKESMFEREVSFASGIIKKESTCPDGFGLVLYDELFHSTNPPDAMRASDLFCSNLWKQKKTISIVSTHVYSLAKNAPETDVKKICLGAWKDPAGKYIFSYKVMRGICEVSSVDLLLKKYGNAFFTQN